MFFPSFVINLPRVNMEQNGGWWILSLNTNHMNPSSLLSLLSSGLNSEWKQGRQSSAISLNKDPDSLKPNSKGICIYRIQLTFLYK